jgi:hypothetical protein
MTADFDPARHIDACAALLGLTITAEQRPGVSQFLTLAAAMAALVEAAPLGGDALDLAGIFSPISPA